jgi:hypothetical protein
MSARWLPLDEGVEPRRVARLAPQNRAFGTGSAHGGRSTKLET